MTGTSGLSMPPRAGCCGSTVTPFLSTCPSAVETSIVGAAVAAGKVFATTQNGHLVALDAATGKPVWDKPFVDIRAGESATVAPLVVKSLVIVGSSGAEYGVRGHIDAFDIETGK